jgi:hypothetical protein
VPRSKRFIIEMANGIFAVPGQSVAVIIKSSKVGGGVPSVFIARAVFFSQIFVLAAGALVYIAYLYIYDSAKLLVEA